MNKKTEESVTLSEVDSFVLGQVQLIDSYGESTALKDIISHKSIILNFVLGSWCPQCMKHLDAINNSIAKSMDADKLEVVLISTESVKILEKKVARIMKKQSSLKSILIASDAQRKLINMFKIRVPVFGFAKPQLLSSIKDH